MFEKMNLLIATVVLLGFVFVRNAENLEISRLRRDVPPSELFPETVLKNFTRQIQVLAGGLLSFNSKLVVGKIYDTKETVTYQWSNGDKQTLPKQRFIQVYENCKIGVVKIESDYDNIHSCSDPDKHNCKIEFEAKFGRSSTTANEFTVGAKLNVKDVLEFSGEYSRNWANQVSQENSKKMEITYSNGQIVLPIQVFGGLSCDVRVFEVRTHCKRRSKCDENPYYGRPYCIEMKKVISDPSKDEEVPCSQLQKHDPYYCHVMERDNLPNYDTTANRSVRCFYRGSEERTYEALQSDCCASMGDNSCYSKFGRPTDINDFPMAACKRTDIPLLNSQGKPLKITTGYVYAGKKN